jgi:hypothetical protein
MIGSPPVGGGESSPLKRSSRSTLLAAILLLVTFAIASSGLTRDSLWNDEGWTVWAVHSPYLADMLARVRGDVHPPLYFLLLDGWVRVTGESAYALRLLSTLFGMIGLGATYAVGKKLFDSQTGLIALVILGTASFFVYYNREARMYTLLLALGAAGTWVYLLWRERPTRLRTSIYGILMAALMYTHYAGALVILTHLVHLVVTYLVNRLRDVRRQTLKRPAAEKDKLTKGAKRVIYRAGEVLPILRLLFPYLLAFLIYLPWLPIFLNQMRANPNGPLAIPVHTDWAAVAALVLILTGGTWGLYLAPFVLGRGIPRLRTYWSAVLLLVVWLLLTPVALLALNAWVAPVYQVRYAIAMLPAGALLLAYGLRWVGLPTQILPKGVQLNAANFSGLIAVFLIAWIAQNQLAIYPELWPEKPPWEPAIRAMIEARNPLDPTITDIAAYSPVAYYDRQLKIRQGVSLDLAWRLHHYDEIMKLVGVFDEAPSVWVALPVNAAKTWHIVAALDSGRHAAYRSSLVNMIFYRFDKGESGDLQYRFGDRVRYESGLSARQRFSVKPGDSLCVDLHLETLAPMDGAYSAGLHLIDITGTTLVAQWDAGLGSPAAGESLALKPCLDIPASVSLGYYHLELVVYQWANEERLRLFEGEGTDALPWGDVLMLAAVDVTE